MKTIHINHQIDNRPGMDGQETFWCEIEGVRFYAATRQTLIEGLKRNLLSSFLKEIEDLNQLEAE